jgi:tyrosyl-tRNA synthetase
VLTTPILEGLDGVQKMSKSLGNAIGIQEPPLEMYGKLMSISDEMMWRYYELLTDVGMIEIRARMGDVVNGKVNPMLFKKDLARMIVADFHSAEAAANAGEDWAKQFQRNQVPEDVEVVSVNLNEVIAPGELSPREQMNEVLTQGIRVKVDKLLAKMGLAASVSDGARKLRQNAVKIDGGVKSEPVVFLNGLQQEHVVQVGRQIKKVRFVI